MSFLKRPGSMVALTCWAGVVVATTLGLGVRAGTFESPRARVEPEGHADREQLYGAGGSAGGLLIGAVANLRPDLFRGLVALVPFVDVVTTMLDDTIPLTTFEYEEWGNPNGSLGLPW